MLFYGIRFEGVQGLGLCRARIPKSNIVTVNNRTKRDFVSFFWGGQGRGEKGASISPISKPSTAPAFQTPHPFSRELHVPLDRLHLEDVPRKAINESCPPDRAAGAFALAAGRLPLSTDYGIDVQKGVLPSADLQSHYVKCESATWKIQKPFHPVFVLTTCLQVATRDVIAFGLLHLANLL